jgi:ATP-dependent Clp protease ATP-binding subunit ClpX
LAQLDESALIRILTEPKNAIVKQFKKLFDFENVELKFTDGALRAVVKEALKRKTGARGLRAILERAMLDVMYDMPSQQNLKEVVITEEVIVQDADPVLVYRAESETRPAEEKKEREFGTGGSHS